MWHRSRIAPSDPGEGSFAGQESVKVQPMEAGAPPQPPPQQLQLPVPSSDALQKQLAGLAASLQHVLHDPAGSVPSTSSCCPLQAPSPCKAYGTDNYSPARAQRRDWHDCAALQARLRPKAHRWRGFSCTHEACICKHW